MAADYGPNGITGYTRPVINLSGSILNKSDPKGGGRRSLSAKLLGKKDVTIIGDVINHGKLQWWDPKKSIHYHATLQAGENTLEMQVRETGRRQHMTNYRLQALLRLCLTPDNYQLGGVRIDGEAPRGEEPRVADACLRPVRSLSSVIERFSFAGAFDFIVIEIAAHIATGGEALPTFSLVVSSPRPSCHATKVLPLECVWILRVVVCPWGRSFLLFAVPSRTAAAGCLALWMDLQARPRRRKSSEHQSSHDLTFLRLPPSSRILASCSSRAS